MEEQEEAKKREKSRKWERDEMDREQSAESDSVHQYQMSVLFRQELLNTLHLKIASRIGLEIAKLSDSSTDILQLLGRCLPHIVPNVILAKREVRGGEERERGRGRGRGRGRDARERERERARNDGG